MSGADVWLTAGGDWLPSRRVPVNEVASKRDAERFAERWEAMLVAIGEHTAMMIEPGSHRPMALLRWPTEAPPAA